MTTWPDKEEVLMRLFIEDLKLRTSGAPYRSVLRGFQRFVCRRSPRSGLSEATIVAWLRQRSKESPIHMVLKSGHLRKWVPGLVGGTPCFGLQSDCGTAPEA